VSGHTRSVICDIQRGSIYLTPSEIVTYFQLPEKIDFAEYCQRSNLSGEYEDLMTYYLANDIVYLIDDDASTSFTELNIEWDHPSLISNCIVEVDKPGLLDSTFIAALDTLLIEAVELRIVGPVNFDEISSIVGRFDSSLVKAIHLYLGHDIYAKQHLENLFISYTRVLEIVVFNCQDVDRSTSSVIYTNNNLARENCGCISRSYFSVNIETFFEAKLHNSCLNRKISIDADGNIKNCPSMKESFGNVRDTTLAEAIEKPGFKKYWDINKDKIHVCKDCEFRYVCTDCRAYVEDPEDILSKPLKCGYNPYTGEWSEWSTNPLKQKAITYYGMEDTSTTAQHGV
jgi:SPASM domain peptide maturase of grasp-with-spasm system